MGGPGDGPHHRGRALNGREAVLSGLKRHLEGAGEAGLQAQAAGAPPGMRGDPLPRAPCRAPSPAASEPCSLGNGLQQPAAHVGSSEEFSH